MTFAQLPLPEDRLKRKPPVLTADCAICGSRIQRNGVGARWRHQRPQPSGAPHDHNAKPQTKKAGPA